MVLLKMLMDIAIPKMGELLVMTMTMISPGREVPPMESLHRRAKVLLPKFRLETAALRPESGPRRAQPTRACLGTLVMLKILPAMAPEIPFDVA